MKRITLLLLALALVLGGCRVSPGSEEPMVQPVQFYYRTAATEFSSEDGVIRAELRDLGTAAYSDQDLFALYFQGPISEDLVSPFTQDTTLDGVRRIGGTLEVLLIRNANSPAVFDHALTDACLAKTGLALEGVRKVRVRVNSVGGALLSDQSYTESDILLFDRGEAPEATELTLYYADETGTLLLTEKRTIAYTRAQDLPQAVVEQLLIPPQSGGMRSPLPPGTAPLDLTLDSGLCTVDFNPDFYNHRPESEQAEALAILSVVNSLCELDGVSQVQFYVAGNRLEQYRYLDLSQAFWMDSAVVGPVREELNEFSAQFCLPGLRDNLLHRLTVRCRARGGTSREATLLQALFSRSLENGMSNPLSRAQPPLSVSVSQGICRVDLAPGTLPQEAAARELAIRSLIATLASLPDLISVELLEGGKPVTQGSVTPEDFWFAAPEQKS